MNKDFRNFAVHHLGMNGLALDQYAASAASQITSSYISPTIIEERQLNVAQMDVFSRLMMDRIIFLSTDVNDYTATVVQGSSGDGKSDRAHQVGSVDPKKPEGSYNGVKQQYRGQGIRDFQQRPEYGEYQPGYPVPGQIGAHTVAPNPKEYVKTKRQQVMKGGCHTGRNG